MRKLWHAEKGIYDRNGRQLVGADELTGKITLAAQATEK